MASQIEVVEKSGQISPGKEFAGQHMLVEQIKPAEWRIRTAVVVPLAHFVRRFFAKVFVVRDMILPFFGLLNHCSFDVNR